MTSHKRWAGRTIIVIAIVHTVFGFLAFGPVIGDIVQSGLWDSVGEDPMRGAVAWFLFAGFFMATTGLPVDALEACSANANFRAVAIALLITAILGIVMMPVSGFWLLLVPAIGLLLKKERAQ